MMVTPEYAAEQFLNVVMGIKRGVPYQQLLNNGFSPEFIKSCKKAILYVEVCYKNKLRAAAQQKNEN